MLAALCNRKTLMYTVELCAFIVLEHIHYNMLAGRKMRYSFCIAVQLGRQTLASSIVLSLSNRVLSTLDCSSTASPASLLGHNPIIYKVWIAM